MKKPSFTERYLDPGARLGEILFGLIMVLTFTLTAGIAIKEGPGAARELLIATLGCNVAWGIIDGAFYIMGALLERSQRTQAVLAIQKAPDEASALRIIEDRLDEPLAGLVTGEERNRLYHDLSRLAKQAKPERTRLNKDDIMGALASCWLVILSTVPAAIPFLFIRHAHLALRVSNFLLVGLLFLVGYSWAKYARASRWGTGLIFLVIGLALVGIAIALGG